MLIPLSDLQIISFEKKKKIFWQLCNSAPNKDFQRLLLPVIFAYFGLRALPALGLTQPAVGYAVERGERLAKIGKYDLLN